MANSVYCLPSDNLAPSATITARAGSTIDAAYPAANLVNINPAKPGKLAETSGGWVFDFGTAVTINLAAIIHHNIAAGSNVRIQANSSDDWDGSPATPFDVAFTIGTYREDGFPLNPWLDLTALGAHSYRYWSIVVVTAQTNPVAIGEIVLATSARTFTKNLAPGLSDDEDHPIVEHRTDHGVSTVYDLGTTWRSWSGEMPVVSDAGVNAVRALARDARGRARPFVFIPDPAVNDAWYVRLGVSAQSVTRYLMNVSQVPIAFQEVSRGLPL